MDASEFPSSEGEKIVDRHTLTHSPAGWRVSVRAYGFYANKDGKASLVRCYDGYPILDKEWETELIDQARTAARELLAQEAVLP